MLLVLTSVRVHSSWRKAFPSSCVKILVAGAVFASVVATVLGAADDVATAATAVSAALPLVLGVRVSTHANDENVLCVRLWKTTCFCRRVLLSFFLLSAFFFSHPESCLKIKICFGKSDVLGGAQGVRHEYEYCDVCVNRSDDNMLDVCFQESQLTSDPTTTPQQCNKRRSTTLPIELISDQRDMSVAGCKNAQIPFLERKQGKRRITSLKLCNIKLDYTSRLMGVKTCAGTS